MKQAPSFKIIRKLDAGGMAEVYHAETESIEGFRKVVAVKKVLPHLVQNEKFLRMFLDEARLSLRMSHANVVQMFDVAKAGGSYYVIMEFVDGSNLKAIFEWATARRFLLPIEQSIFIILETCKGLQYAHDLTDLDGNPLQIVHRDVSPPNILISKQGEVKLVDFGLAKATTQLEHTDPGIIKGKFSYLSPEAAEGHEVDRRADIFSAGILLFEMLSGRRLFYGQNDYETVEQVRVADIPSLSRLNPAVPKELERIVLRALARDVRQRYQTAQEFGNDLYQFLFSRGLKVSSFDISDLVKTVLRESKAPKPAAATSIIDKLIEEELGTLTSIEDKAGLFTDGDKPLSTEEISGAFSGDAGGLEDPRTWGMDFDDGAALRLPQTGTQATWRETRPTPLPSVPAKRTDPTRASGRGRPQPAPSAAPAAPRSPTAPRASAVPRSSTVPPLSDPVEPAPKSPMRWLAIVAVLMAAAIGVLLFLVLK